MVKLMLEGFSASHSSDPDDRDSIQCYHVDARFSDTLEDIGSFRLGKFFLLLRYCMQAIWLRIRHGVHAFYYVPAPGKRAALIRDWVVMLLCRPFFKHFIHHWHAVGLGDWLAREGTWIERRLTHWLLGKPSLGMALAIPSMRDALWFRSRDVELVPNGIPDPCPDFESAVLPERKRRLENRIALANSGTPNLTDEARIFRVLFLANIVRDKGILDTLEGVAIANAQLRQVSSPFQIHLTVAGPIPDESEELAFKKRIQKPDLEGAVTFAGFVSGEAKQTLLRGSDCLCFPTYYHAEGFPLVVIEAMAAGMAVVATRWRALPEILPPNYPGIIPIRNPEAIASALIAAMLEDATGLRARFQTQFTESAHLDRLKEAILSLEAS